MTDHPFPLPFPKKNRKPTDADRRKLRGTLWQCPYCRQGFPLADTGTGLVPVQLTILKGLHPIGNIVDSSGQPLEKEVGRLVKSTAVREIPVLVPHMAVCIPAMRAQGIAPSLYAGVLLEPPGAVPPPEVAKPNDEN